MSDVSKINRRHFIAGAAGVSVLPYLGIPGSAAAAQLAKPAAGVRIPVIGMGSWLTFDVGQNRKLRDQRREVLKAFFAAGGGMIDSSPMYGTSEEVIGDALAKLPPQPALFSATKVWTVSKWLGVRQMNASQKLWGLDGFDLMQIHNMLDWETHLETLKQWKAEKRIRFIGITTSHGRRHAAIEQAIASEPFDFVQLTYNLRDRAVEKRLLPLAMERGLGVIINRPFRRGGLFDTVKGSPLPDWAAEFDCSNWAQFFLKFVVSHPAVTCAIPATSRVDHMNENMGAGTGRLPDAAMRKRMIAHFDSL
ncbi:MAG: aldo/keto reductase [Aestuariivirgaceae bacterium]